MKSNIGLLVVCGASFFIISLSLFGCTEFRVVAQDKSVIIGRSMEWGDDMHSRIIVKSRGQKYSSTAPDGKKGLEWKSRYGFICINAYGIDGATDGMNEKGLSVGALFFPKIGGFQTVPEGQQAKAITQLDVMLWLLGNFETTAQVAQAIKDVYVWGAPIDLPQKKNAVFPLHFGVYDASGKGIVIEYTKQGLTVFDNEVGVLTNSPTFDWHVTNLGNYVGLSSSAASAIKIGNNTFAPLGQGSGLRGIPGDPTPPSRFVRAATMVNLADPADNAQGAVTLASHILNTVDIPVGTVKDLGQSNLKDYSQWIVIKDLTNKHLYFRTYKNSTLRKIDLNQLDFASPEKASLSIEDGAAPYIDVTKQLVANNVKK